MSYRNRVRGGMEDNVLIPLHTRVPKAEADIRDDDANNGETYRGPPYSVDFCGRRLERFVSRVETSGAQLDFRQKCGEDWQLRASLRFGKQPAQFYLRANRFSFRRELFLVLKVRLRSIP